jgi:serine/threonine protein kinase/tetratricopeptide (TPR) repeat protein
MTPDLWQRIKPLFNAALEIPEEERARFVSKVCGEDEQVREELAALLKANDEHTTFDDSPIMSFKSLLPPKMDPFFVGALILNRFRIVRHIGAGGMGNVYEATDLELGRVALKTIRADIASSPDMLARFRKEVQIARRISGPHVCRIHELFVMTGDNTGSHVAFLTMEFLDGVTLADKLRKSGPLPWKEAQAISIEICDGLQTIHEAGIIHRDLKSQNIMLASRNGSTCAVLMDFGLARELSATTSATLTDFTRTGVIVGTPNYMAPEQFESKDLTPATDVYALGIVLYELVTGEHPFAASSPIGAAILRGRRPCLASSIRPGLPHRFDDVICKCLEFDAKRRYQSAKDVAEDLQDRLFSVTWFRHGWLRILGFTITLLIPLSSVLLIPAVRERLQGVLFSSREKHIAVLPFDLAGDDPDTVALGDGLMDSLSDKLSNLDGADQSLWVVPASVVRDRKIKDPSSALREFGATIAIKGRFERHGQTAHLNLTLIDTKKMREIGFADVENQNGDLASLQDEALTRLGRLMNTSVRDKSVHLSDGPVSRSAYEDYLTGIGYFQRFDKPGNLDLAIKSLENAVDTDPHFALAFAHLAQAYTMKSRYDPNPLWVQRAETYCTKAYQLDDRVPSTYVALAQVQELRGNHELAIEEFQRAIDLDPRNAEAVAGIASSSEEAGHFADAEAGYIKASALRPDDWMGYNTLGNFYDARHRSRDAIAQYKKALKLTPDNSGLYTNLGAAYIDLDDPKMLGEAEEALKHSLSIDPTYGAYANLGYMYAQEHRFNDSIEANLNAVKLYDQSYDAWSNLTAAYEWVGDDTKANEARQKAIELLERTVEVHPRNARAQATLAAMRAKNGLRDKAMDGIRISLVLGPKNRYALAEVADAYELLGDRHHAIKYLKEALANGLPKGQLSEDPEIQGVISDPAFRRSEK